MCLLRIIKLGVSKNTLKRHVALIIMVRNQPAFEVFPIEKRIDLFFAY